MDGSLEEEPRRAIVWLARGRLEWVIDPQVSARCFRKGTDWFVDPCFSSICSPALRTEVQGVFRTGIRALFGVVYDVS